MLSAFETIAVLLSLTAGFAWLNHRPIGLPDAIGLLLTLPRMVRRVAPAG